MKSNMHFTLHMWQDCP